MVISNGNMLKKPKVVEECLDSDSSDDSEADSEVEIKEEVEDDYLNESNLQGESFNTTLSADEIKEEDDEEEEGDNDEGEGSDSEIKETKRSKRKRTTEKVTRKETEHDSDSSDDDESEEDDDFDGDDESEEEDDVDAEDESESEKEGDENDTKNTGSGLANMMAKILGTKKSDDIILSKAQTDNEVKKKKKKNEKVLQEAKDTFEVVDSSGKVITEPVTDKIKEEEEEEEEEKKPPISIHDRELYRKVWEEKFRKKPNITEDRDKERKLRVMATQGVVQLFSAIEKHRSMMQVKLSECRSVMGREKVLEGTGKEAFMDILKQQGKRVKEGMQDKGRKMKEEEDGMKEEVKDEPLDLQLPVKKKAKWNVLSDNFYKEPTLHGWDQESDDDDN